MTSESPSSEQLTRLCNTMTQLRSPEGCPWDAEQTPSSLKPYIIEEAYELVDAIDGGNPQQIKEELGDLLLQVVFQAEIFTELGLFTLDDVIGCISEKLIRRHPHVFSSSEQIGPEHHELRWDRIKADEKSAAGEQPGLLSNLPEHLPALQTAQKIFSKLKRHACAHQIVLDINATCEKDAEYPLRAATASSTAKALFRIVMNAEENGIDAETALREFNNRLKHRAKETKPGQQLLPANQSAIESTDSNNLP